jgi:3-hydroxyisobutyrate dehydrogenase
MGDVHGFIGLGRMGWPMAENLLRAGFPLIVFDVRVEVCQTLAQLGAQVVGSPAEVGERASVVHVNVLNAAQAEDVLLDEQHGVFHRAKPGTLVVLHSTTGPEVCGRLAVEAALRDIRLVDAPTTGGGSVAAARAELTLIVGGEDDDLHHLRPTFDAMASRVVHVGPFGSGQVAKLVNNLLAVVNSVVLEEALRLAAACGLRAHQAVEVADAGTGGSFVASHRDDLARMARNATDGRGGQIAMSRKDLIAVLELGRSVGEWLPMTALATDFTDTLFVADPTDREAL